MLFLLLLFSYFSFIFFSLFSFSGLSLFVCSHLSPDRFIYFPFSHFLLTFFFFLSILSRTGFMKCFFVVSFSHYLITQATLASRLSILRSPITLISLSASHLPYVTQCRKLLSAWLTSWLYLFNLLPSSNCRSLYHFQVRDLGMATPAKQHVLAQGDWAY